MSNVSALSVKDVGGIALKVDLIADAYSQLRISGLTVSPTPEDLELALMRLENMSAEWQMSLETGYNFEEEPDPNTDANIKRSFWHAFATNLAVRLIPDFNKQVPQALMAQAMQSYSKMAGNIGLARLNQTPYPTRQPVGSGNSLRYNRWQRFYRRSEADTNTTSVIEMFKGDVNDYVEHFDAYLNDGETISSFDIVSDSGVTIESSSNTYIDVNYRVKATGTDETGVNSTRQVTIIVTTSEGRVETRFTLFQIYPRGD